MRKKILFAVAISILSSCTSVNGPLRDVTDGVGLTETRNDRATGAEVIISEYQLTHVDLIDLLDPEKRRFAMCVSENDQFSTDTGSDPGEEKHKKANRAEQVVCNRGRMSKNRDRMSKNRDRMSELECKYNRTLERRASRDYLPSALTRARDFMLDANARTDSNNTAVAALDLQCAFNAFYTYGENNLKPGGGFKADIAEKASTSKALIIRRNAVQDQILAVSEKACNNFKISINDRITKANFAFGSIATTLAGLGAVFTDPATARALSGASAIVSGVRAEYNESYLQSLTVKVITAGIDARRADIRDEINGRRFGKPPALMSTPGSSHFLPLRPYLASRPYLALSPYDKWDENLSRNSNVILDLETKLRRYNEEIFTERNERVKLKEQIQTADAGGNDEESADLKKRDEILVDNIENLKKRVKSLKEDLERAKEYAADQSPSDDSTAAEGVGLVPLSQYTVEMAIHDAIKYHAACTIPVGLEKAADSVEQVRNPGTATLQRAVQTMNILQGELNQNAKLRSRSAIENIENHLRYLEAEKELQEKLDEKN